MSYIYSLLNQGLKRNVWHCITSLFKIYLEDDKEIASTEYVRTDSLKMGFKFLGCYPNTRN